MARIKGVEIPNEKKIVVSLTYIYGVGPTTAKKVLEAVKIDENNASNIATSILILKSCNLLNSFFIDSLKFLGFSAILV